jgi:hypothetical protein
MPSDEVMVRLTRSQREALDLQAVEETAGWVGENWPAPGERVETVFALGELGVTEP